MKDIMEVRGVGRSTADKLRAIGIETVGSLARANSGTVARKTGLPEVIGARLIAAAREASAGHPASGPPIARSGGEPKREANASKGPVVIKTKVGRAHSGEQSLEAGPGRQRERGAGVARAAEVVKRGLRKSDNSLHPFKRRLLEAAIRTSHIRQLVIRRVVENMLD